MRLLMTLGYLTLFQVAAWPAIARVLKRQSSADLSVWREWAVLGGVVIQFAVFWLDGASWYVLASPVVSGASLALLLGVIYRYR